MMSKNSSLLNSPSFHCLPLEYIRLAMPTLEDDLKKYHSKLKNSLNLRQENHLPCKEIKMLQNTSGILEKIQNNSPNMAREEENESANHIAQKESNSIKTSNVANEITIEQCNMTKLHENDTPTSNVKKTNSVTNLKSPFDYELYKRYKKKAMDSYAQKKIFTIYGTYHTLRMALKNRGWVEKINGGPYRHLKNLPDNILLEKAKDGNGYEVAFISKILEKFPAYFIWQPKRFEDQYAHVTPFRNRIRREVYIDFTLKDGLIECAKKSIWNTIPNVAEIRVPKSYKLSTSDDQIAFLHYYRFSYSLGLLIFFAEDADHEVYFAPEGILKCNVIDFAMRCVREAIAYREHEDIDKSFRDIWQPTEQEWEEFRDDFDNLTAKRQKIRLHDLPKITKYMKESNALLKKALFYWPNMCMDGYSNLWIMKPSGQCRGMGIQIMSDYTKIINQANKFPKKKYIVQKYIERPSLIYKTKFDIRQYILITVTTHINVWMYKNCYLRFSSQEFSLSDLNESIHLTNNAVQSKYSNGSRSELIPSHNMWALREYKTYLNKIGKNGIWKSKIYPGMKKNSLAVVLASLEGTDFVLNSFELYGCDFMLNEELEPILIEVNSTPDMASTTCVTADICPAALEDVVKVVVDLSNDLKASTGDFELIYSVPWTGIPNYTAGLVVQGTQIAIDTSNLNILPKIMKQSISRNNKNSQNRNVTRTKKKSGPALPSSKKHKRSNCDAQKPQVPLVYVADVYEKEPKQPKTPINFKELNKNETSTAK